jgi:hypothetical protein
MRDLTFFEQQKNKKAREYWQKYLPLADILLLKSIEAYLLAPSFVPNPARRTEPQPFNLYYALARAKRHEMEEFNKMVRKGSKAWASVPNGADWVDELRGGDK